MPSQLSYITALFVLEFSTHRLFLKSLKNLKTLKMTTFRRMNVLSSLGKKGGDTYSVGSSRSDLWIRLWFHRPLPTQF
jgi:hypothetical protein